MDFLSAFCGDDDLRGIEESILNFSRNSSVPDFSVCSQNTFLVWIPSAFVCLCCLVWFVCLCRTKTFDIRRSYFNIFKLVVCFIIFIVYLVNLVRSSVGRYSTYELHATVKYAVQVATTMLLTFVMWFEYKKRVHSSCAVSISWLVLVGFGLVELRSRIINVVEHDPFQTYSYFVSFLFVFVEFVCCFFSDLSVLADLPKFKVDEPLTLGRKSEKVLRHCPEERACFFSRVTFFWISGLMWKGYRKALTYDDLFEVRSVDRSDAVVPRFERLWLEEVERTKEKMSRNTGRNRNAGNNQNLNNNVIYTNNSNNNNSNNNKNNNKKGAAKKNDRTGEESIQMLPTSKSTGTKVETKVKTSNLNSRVSLTRVVARMFGWSYLIGGLMKLLYDLIAFLLPLLLNFLILFIKSPTSPTWLGLSIVMAMFSVSYLRTFLIQQYWHVCFVVGQHLRTAIVGAVYRKALRLSNTARRGATVGEIVNLMSIDAQKFDDASQFLHMIWSTPLIIAISVYMLWQFLGPSVLAGVLCMMLMIPVNGYIATKTKKLQVEQMKYKDSRVKMITEILNGIKVLKLYAWEEFFSKNVSGIRGKEIKVLRTAQLLSAASAISWFMTPFFVALSTFAVYVVSSPENVLDANKTFVSLSLFNMLNYPISILPMVINSLVQVSVSTKRLKNFLLEGELKKYVEEDGCLGDENAIEIENASFSWGEDENYVLRDINVTIKKGQLVAVVGQVGSGKSSLISAICGEMDVCKGSVRTKGSIAYVAQQAWIQNATIRDNIVFSGKYLSSFYKKIVDACALRPDFQVLPGADQTEVGEKGINLSGGQKQRLSLARALYQNTDIYLLDDPMASVDTHVGEHIFSEVIGKNGLLQKKTRILVTNQVSLLPHVDLILVLKDGLVSEIGTYQELMSRKSPFTELIQQHLRAPREEKGTEAGEVGAHKITSISSEMVQDLRRRFKTSISSSGSEEGEQNAKDKARLMTEEIAMTGNVKFSVVLRYIKASRVVPALSFILFYIFFLVSHVSGGLWLSFWSNSPPSNDTSDRDYRIGVYGGIGVAQVIGVLGLMVSLAILCTRCSENLHRSLLESLLRAPMSFFDTTPQGRIVNRFSRDVDILDVTIPITLRIWFGTFSGVIATFFVVCYTIPIFMAALLPLAVFYYFVQRFYISTSRELRRLDSNFRSPIYAHFGETVVGSSSIRAYRVQGRFVRMSDELVDRSLVTNYPIIVSNRWLGILVESVGIATLVLCAMFAVLQKDSIDAGLAGLSLSCSMQITLTLNVFVRMMSELETNIVSVERIDEYIDCPHEAPTHTSVVVPPNWPESGKVEFVNYSTRYRENLDLTLKDFSCTFNPGEKVGIVGRTGAGKSSLALALFRIVEAASGSIAIDDVAIATLGLYDLRSRLTIIPQDPVLFSGTLRMNIDPSGLKSDDEIWDVLGHASLQTFVSGMPEKLMAMCTEGGGNLSVGQRQLICLSRALLRKTNILVLDEATAAIDMESDALIQKTIREEFAKCTVITIAHRLNTIIDYDRILVLEEGKLVEFDSPKNLLANNSSRFYDMARSANLLN